MFQVGDYIQRKDNLQNDKFNPNKIHLLVLDILEEDEGFKVLAIHSTNQTNMQSNNLSLLGASNYTKIN